MTPTIDWLTLSDASALLGIHPITLRTWVDAGLVRAFRTPGKHRRFRRTELVEFMEQQRVTTVTRSLILAQTQTLEHIRQAIDTKPIQQAAWYAQLSDLQRSKQRELGQRLLGLLLQFVGRKENAHEFLNEGQQLAREYGLELAQAGLSASDLARAFLFFRRTVINATFHPDGTQYQADADGVLLLQRINTFMDELLIATLDAYDQVKQARSLAPHSLPASSATKRKTRSSPTGRRKSSG